MEKLVRSSSREYRELLSYISASRALNGWIEGARALALLVGAEECGVLDAVQTGGTAEEIASATGLQLRLVDDLCLALVDHGVLVRVGDAYQLSPDYALLASQTAAVPLPHVIRQASVMVRALQTVGRTGADYTTLPSEDVLAMALGAGISPLSTAPHVSPETTGQMLPEVQASWQAGARHLEVGCGVGNALLGLALTYPRVTAVGIEIDEQTAAEAQRRAELLGIADRVSLRRMDACDLRDVESFDTIQWSQFFFPAASRPPVLAAMRRALTPGGYLIMPWLSSSCENQSARRGAMLRMALRGLRSGGRSFASFLNDALRDTSRRRVQESRFSSLQRLLFGRWGVPVRSTRELTAEVEAAGFEVVRTTFTPVNQFVLTRGLLLARRG